MKVLIRHGLPPTERAEAAQLYWRTFRGKLGRVMGPEPKALAFIERVIDPSHALIATESSGKILGLIGFRTANGCFVGGDGADLRAIYGRFGGFWRRIALDILASDLAREDICVDGLAVSEGMRGLGLGSALMEALLRLAAEQGYAHLRLDVVSENLRAKALYDRLGFETVQHSDRWLTMAVFGYRRRIAMCRKL